MESLPVGNESQEAIVLQGVSGTANECSSQSAIMRHFVNVNDGHSNDGLSYYPIDSLS